MAKPKRSLEERVALAAQAALDDHSYVSPIDVLIGIGWLQPVHVQAWRTGRIPYLEGVIQTNLNKITMAMNLFRAWAEKQGLVPSQTVYYARTRGPKQELRFSKSRRPSIEKSYKTHYVSPALSTKKMENLQNRLSRAPELVVYQIIRDSRCSRCGRELGHGNLLLMDGENPLCMCCAGMDDLVFVPSGNAKLTRRVKKYSTYSAVVVRFSRARKRFERQGVLADREALDRAEKECQTE